MRPDGSGSRKLLAAAHPWPQWDPAVSPNGSLLAFRGYYAPFAEGNFALYVVNTDGCALRRVTRSGAVNPSWSPDGRWIAFDTSGGGEIWKVRPDGSGLIRIAGNGRAEQDSSPAWSPDGSRIAFIRVRRRHGQIWVMRPDGSGATLLHKDARASDGTPVWSRDGTRIAFVVQAWPRSWIEVMQADGTKLRVLTVESGAASNPVVAKRRWHCVSRRSDGPRTLSHAPRRNRRAPPGVPRNCAIHVGRRTTATAALLNEDQEEPAGSERLLYLN